jgi:hypothetical protein
MAYIRGALVEFMPTMLVPIPNVIVFQFNPESMTHTWTQPEPVAQAPAGQPKTNPLAVKGFPAEQFSFTIAMDAGDTIADGAVSAGLAEVSGVYTRLAALEMLMFPASATQDGLLGAVTGAIGGLLGAKPPVKRKVPANTMPTVIFVWGPGRIVPVRVTSLTITEKLYDGLLNPTHAEAQLGLRVLTTEELKAVSDTLAVVARAAYQYSMGLRQVLAVANLINSAESVIGMLPL